MRDEHARCHFPKTLDKKTGRSQEAVVIFLFGLEVLITRDFRAQPCAVSSLSRTVPMLLLAIMVMKPLAISSYSDQASGLFSSLYHAKILFCYPVVLHILLHSLPL
jgi:hypothetical protein